MNELMLMTANKKNENLPYSVHCIDGAIGMLTELENNSVKLLYGSPPYPNADRNYGNWSSDEYISRMTPFIDAAVLKLRDDGFLVLNIKANREKNKNGINTRRSLVVEKLAILLEEKWNLYCVDIEIWIKDNPVPTGLRVACQDAYEQILWFAKNPKWKINIDAIRRPYSEESIKTYANNTFKPRGNGLSYVRKEKTITPNINGALPLNIVKGAVSGKQGTHQAVQPGYLPEKYIYACTNIGDLVIDPWLGSGTTGRMAILLRRKFVGFEIHKEYAEMAKENIHEAYLESLRRQKVSNERAKLQQQFLSNLGDVVIKASSNKERPLIVRINKPYELSLVIYLFPGTNPPGGRKNDEYKFNLNVPYQKPGEKGNFDSTDGIPLLIAYVESYDVYVIFDCKYHKNFSCNANIQFKQSVLLEAYQNGIAFAKKGNGESIIAIKADNIILGISKWFDKYLNS